MNDLEAILQKYGRRHILQPGEILIRQGAASDGIYYLETGELGVYWEDGETAFLLSLIAEGEIVGEIGAATGGPRTATVRATQESHVIHISEADFHRAMKEDPRLAAEVISTIGCRLSDANVAQVTLGRSYRQAIERVHALRTQKARLEELLQLREELANMIVHDLRNPLSVISSGLDLLRDTPGAVSSEEYIQAAVEAMEQSARRMQRMVNMLLDITHLEEGRLQLNRQPLDIASIIAAVKAEEDSLAESYRIFLEARLPEHLPLVLADRDLILRVLFNLLDNALKFTPTGGQVRIEAERKGDWVEVRVLDTGPGIPLAERERVFEKFTQVRRPVRTRSGTGLGLAFCRMAVEAHGGRIWVDSGPKGVGSCFFFTVPLAQEEEASSSPPDSPQPAV